MEKQFTDQVNRKVAVLHPPQRIVSLVPSLTETLFHFGLEEKIVGRTKFCIHPEEKVKKKPWVGGTKMLHFDRVRDLNPDLILANKEENRKEDFEQLEQEYPVWVSYVISFEDALEMILGLGKITGCTGESKRLTQQIQERFDQIPTPDEPLRVAYFIWRKPYMVAGGNTFINSILKLCGFKNVFESWGRYPKIQLSDLHQLEPDVLLLSDEPFPFKDEHMKEIEAVYDKGLTHRVDGGIFSWYGSRLLKTPEYLSQLINTISLIRQVS